MDKDKAWVRPENKKYERIGRKAAKGISENLAKSSKEFWARQENQKKHEWNSHV